jgi:hypothetical protein
MKTSLLEEPPHQEFHPGPAAGTDSPAFSVAQYTPDQQSEWDAFMPGSKNSTFLFYRDYMDYHRDRFTDHSLMVFRNGELAALFPANLKSDGTMVSHEGLTFGGLIVPRPATLPEVVGCFRALLRHLHLEQISRLLYKRIPAFYNVVPDDDLAYALFLLDARLVRRDTSTTISLADRLPLRKNHQRLLKKALDRGVHIVQETSLQPFWERVLAPQLAARYSAKPVHTLDEITLLASRFPEQIKQFSAYCGDEILAGATVYETSTVAHTQYTAVTEKGREVGAQALLFVSLIDQYQDKRYFDFGTSNEKESCAVNHGLLDWKEGFGARCQVHDSYEILTANYTNLDSCCRAKWSD